jgi:hypothetical protein
LKVLRTEKARDLTARRDSIENEGQSGARKVLRELGGAVGLRRVQQVGALGSVAERWWWWEEQDDSRKAHQNQHVCHKTSTQLIAHVVAEFKFYLADLSSTRACIKPVYYDLPVRKYVDFLDY